MKRRDFIAGTAALLVSPRRSWAQGKPRRIGYLDTAPLYLPNYKVWQDSMRDHGWIEGKNLIVDYRSAEGHAERLVARHSDFDSLIPSQLRIGRFSGGTRISMLLGMSALRRMRPLRSSVTII